VRHVLTLIAKPGSVIPADVLSKFGAHAWLEPDIACDIFFDEKPSLPSIIDLDYVLQPVARRDKKLLISDMDSTMIQQECIDELADLVGKKEEVAAITERAMNGELDFKAALRERVALLTGLSETDMLRVYNERITLMPGARTLIETLKARGCYSVLVSGGFTFFTSRVAAAIGFDADEANRLEMAHGVLSGCVIEPILDKDSKREALLRIAAARGVSRENTLAIGDGANDVPMLLEAGLGVAYHAKPSVRAQAAAQINHNDLSALLYVMGIPKREWVTASAPR
jgi:phosphoserine phosphatase